MKSVTKFSGGGGVDLGMKAAGWDHAYGIEYDDKIASVARNNGLNTITADILKIKPEDYSSMDWMHDSPPCPNFSTAKANGEETENDIALAQAVCDWIVYHRPKFYTLENVYGYRKSKSWAMIADTLTRQGYSFNFWHVNMADYGVPQTRKRMIVIARLDGKTPHLPPKTHAENPTPGLFGTLKRWVSWYEAIEDLIPTLPDSVNWPNWAYFAEKSSNTYALNSNRNSKEWANGNNHIQKSNPMCSIAAQKTTKDFLVCIDGEETRFTYDCIKRFCTFPDWYKAPKNTRVYGNAVPPLFMQRVGEMFAEDIRLDKRISHDIQYNS